MRDLLISELDLFLLLLHWDLPSSLDEIPANTQLVILWLLLTTTIHATPSSNLLGTLYALSVEPDLVPAKSFV